jgi:radical SAM protein with 4Fe4S-binding SPASM domain
MFNMVVSAENYRQMADVVGLARELGIQQVSFNAINFVSMPDMGNADYRLFSSDEFVAEFGKAAARARELGIRMASFDFAGPPGFKKCRFPWNDFYVTWDGYLVPCCAKPFPLELNFGNVFEKGIMACVNSVEFSEFRKAWHRNEAPGFCDRCHMIGIHNDRKSLLRIRR